MAAELVVTKLAEAVVSQAVQRITDLLVHEAASLSSVRDDIQNLVDELTWIQSFLKDADHKQEQDERVRIWVAEVRDIACEIEDAIEIYIFKVHSSYIKAFHLRKLRTQIDFIAKKLKLISERRERYQIEFNSSERANTLRNLRRSFPDDEEDHAIILKADTMAALKNQVMKEEDRRCIVSIVGMGGLGKTTLARKLYNDVDVKKHFDCYAWVFISQQCVPSEVLSEIIIQVGFHFDQHERRNSGKDKSTKEILEERKNAREILKGLQDGELIDLMKNELKEKRYLIVLDDIWSIVAWSRIQRAFPKGKLGSKVVFTTRIETVASSVDPHSFPIKPSLLTPTESWELLRRKVFGKETLKEHGCPKEFEELSKEMVEKCEGLPLAIVVLGGLLRSKNSLDEWEKVRKDLNSHVINKLKSEQQYRVQDILQLSFQDLPLFLKPCFLYLGSFPEDSEISKRKLIRLWIAEVFIPKMRKEEVEGTLTEDVAEQYFAELVNRCMVQVAKRDHTGKRVKTFRLHDLMRDFCMSKSDEEVFLGIMDQNKTNMMIAEASSFQNSNRTRSRRIAIHVNHGLRCNGDSVEQVHPHLRSLLCFGIHALPFLSLRNKNFVLLRVLVADFAKYSSPDAKLLTGIGNLIYLRYLRVSSFMVGELKLPHSIGNLRNLQTLDLQNNRNVNLPWTMSRLTSLRHLLLPDYRHAAFPMIRSNLFGKHSLTNTETLKGIHARDLIRNGVVLTLSNIRNLKVKRFRNVEEVRLVLESLGSRLGSLRSLGMELDKDDFPNLEILSHCHDLTKLVLIGGCSSGLSLQNFSFLPKSLTKLVLKRTGEPIQEKLAVFEKLPHLRILQMRGHSTIIPFGYKWVCSINGFPKLEILKLGMLGGLEEWKVEEGAMPNLKRLDIKYCRKLWMIPEGLKYVTTLLELNISEMRKVFEDRLRVEDGIEGKDFYKVRHIPNISISKTLMS